MVNFDPEVSSSGRVLVHNAAMYCSGRPDLRMRIRRLKMYLLPAAYTGVYHDVRLVLV